MFGQFYHTERSITFGEHVFRRGFIVPIMDFYAILMTIIFMDNRFKNLSKMTKHVKNSINDFLYMELKEEEDF